ncbi:hypothetical protein ABFV99_13545 [Cytobacillus horneckiae]|uniref:hypothetical protein n=1 Tax=Cytobacillus horneckiae TaxID=549687 RepID=UPI0034CD4E8A
MKNSLPIEEDNINPGRVYLGLVKVEMDRIFIFGSQERLHEMVSFVPGMGNGSYEVYGEIKDVPGFGFRITKVEIEMVTNEEIKYYEKNFSDYVMEVSR